MTFSDDTLAHFAADGPPALPGGTTRRIDRPGASVWYADFGSGAAVILLHGGLGNAGNWGYQVPTLIDAGYRVVAVDSRGHGRSSWDGHPFGYDDMADDVLAIMDEAGIDRAAVIGWSDGAVTGLAMARKQPERVAGVLHFGCNVDPEGALPFVFTPLIGRCLERHRADHAALSPQPDAFDALSSALSIMQRDQPNYSATDLAAIGATVTVVHAEGDEFIRRAHADYIAATIPGAELVLLAGVTHFAPVQRPAQFNAVVLGFLERLQRDA